MTEVPPSKQAGHQTQHLQTISLEEAHRRLREHLTMQALPAESVPLVDALGRVLAEDLVADIDVPGFDRANVDGFAVRAADLAGADAGQPATLSLNDELLTPGRAPQHPVTAGTATIIATGGMLPRGADAVLMVEDSEREGDMVKAYRTLAPGRFLTFAGSDIARGETILFRGQTLGSREIGILAALGHDRVTVVRNPRVAVLSTGDELVAPGQRAGPGQVHDSNSAIVSAAIRELGGAVIPLGICPDDEAALEHQLRSALPDCDMVLLSGGTSKGAGDLSHHVIERLGAPGIIAHGVALKPGKPICIAVCDGKPVVILPGFPTSAIFTFHEFIAPVIRRWAGLPPERVRTAEARLPLQTPSELGRTEFLLVGLSEGPDGLAAYPMGKGSGAVTAFSKADGFITIDALTQSLPADSPVNVRLIGETTRAADLIAVGSHCVGLDTLLAQLSAEGLQVKAMHVGSTGGLVATRRGECDLAGVHLMDAGTGAYNRPFISPGTVLIPGYRRMQGLVYRKDDPRFQGLDADSLVRRACADRDCLMINRNPGSGTRVLINQLLGDNQPAGFGMQARSHNAVAAAVANGRADWGMAIDVVAWKYDLAFLPVQEECYDFVVPESRLQRPGVQRFLRLLGDPTTREALAALGLRLDVAATDLAAAATS